MDTTGRSEALDLWCETLTTYRAVSSALEHELQVRHDLGLTEFELLQRLTKRCGDEESGKVKMKDLESEMFLSQSALSRAVTRMERSGLVIRTTCDADRRAAILQLTAEGRRRWESAFPDYVAILEGHFASRIQHAEQDVEEYYDECVTREKRRRAAVRSGARS
jgi:DNA-binding MarR family transcriptional regulator